MNLVTKWLLEKALVQTILEGGRILCLIGGLTILVSGILFFAWSRLALGLIATVVSGQLKHMLWSIAVIVVGLVAYQFEGGGFPWSLGSVLVILAGAAGLFAHFLKRV